MHQVRNLRLPRAKNRSSKHLYFLLPNMNAPERSMSTAQLEEISRQFKGKGNYADRELLRRRNKAAKREAK